VSAPTERPHFDALADSVCRAGGVDRVSLALDAEASDFLRFNRAALRQATHVLQVRATLAVVRGRRRAESSLTLTGDLALDTQRLLDERTLLTHDLALIPDDPWLLLPEAAHASHRDDRGALPSPAAVIDAVRAQADGLDFVGFYAGGPVVRAYADSLGARHWHRVESFDFEWCLYHAADKAVKTQYGGTAWSLPEFTARLREAAAQLALLRQPARTLPPGAYRALFSPAAMNELLSTLGWSGFGLKSRRTGVSSLLKLAHGDARLHPSVRMSEAPGRGFTPAFTADGFVRPAEVLLASDGRAVDTLNAPRSAREYSLPANGANAAETPEALTLAPGTLPHERLLETLESGLYVSNLWYLNYSDRQACRMTGMTRFACFWVEGGELAAPLEVMRFDDSFLRLFGDGLVGLGDRCEVMPDSSTYQSRQLASITAPAAIVDGWRLTL
jgi:predicted Zn-dependent protease